MIFSKVIKIKYFITMVEKTWKKIFLSEEDGVVVLVTDGPPAGWTVLAGSESHLETSLTEDMATDGWD